MEQFDQRFIIWLIFAAAWLGLALKISTDMRRWGRYELLHLAIALLLPPLVIILWWRRDTRMQDDTEPDG